MSDYEQTEATETEQPTAPAPPILREVQKPSKTVKQPATPKNRKQRRAEEAISRKGGDPVSNEVASQVGGTVDQEIPLYSMQWFDAFIQRQETSLQQQEGLETQLKNQLEGIRENKIELRGSIKLLYSQRDALKQQQEKQAAAASVPAQ